MMLPKFISLLGLCLTVVITAWRWNLLAKINSQGSSLTSSWQLQQNLNSQNLHINSLKKSFHIDFDTKGASVTKQTKKSCIKRTTRTGLTTLFTALSLLYQNDMPLPASIDIQPAYALYNSAKEAPAFPTRGFQTKSGLKYFDLYKSENTRTPRYGEFVSFRYAMMYRPYGGQLQLIDSTNVGRSKQDRQYLNTHGNNRLIKGLDEALHTMTVGSRRRLIIPANLGYVESAKGPIPLLPANRRALNKVIDDVAADKGELIFDVELLSIIRNENDFGYYDDTAVSTEEIEGYLKNAKAEKENFDRMREEAGARTAPTRPGLMEDRVKVAK